MTEMNEEIEIESNSELEQTIMEQKLKNITMVVDEDRESIDEKEDVENEESVVELVDNVNKNEVLDNEDTESVVELVDEQDVNEDVLLCLLQQLHRS